MPEIILATEADLTTHANKSASTSQAGHVQLNNTVTSTSTTQAATANAVKTAYDRAEAAFQSASDGKTAIANAITGKGGTATSSDTFAQLASAISNISTGKKVASGTVTSDSTGHITVTGLDFTPKIILFFHAARRGTYAEDNTPLLISSVNQKVVVANQSGTQVIGYNLGSGNGASSYVNSSGFKLYTTLVGSYSYQYVAIE